jgi:hypothetical protein
VNEIARQAEETAQHLTGAPTHVLWRDGAVEFVTLDGLDADNPDLVPIPEGLDLDWVSPDFETRTLVLDAARLDAELHAKIDREAGELRCRFITDIPGQALTYQRKESEARRFLADEPGTFPMLAAEAAALDEPIEDVAARVLAKVEELAVLGGLIEGARIGAKVAVALAETAEAKRAAARVDWAALLAPRRE